MPGKLAVQNPGGSLEHPRLEVPRPLNRARKGNARVPPRENLRPQFRVDYSYELGPLSASASRAGAFRLAFVGARATKPPSCPE